MMQPYSEAKPPTTTTAQEAAHGHAWQAAQEAVPQAVQEAVTQPAQEHV